VSSKPGAGHLIVRRVYKRDEFPTVLGRIPEAPSPVPGEESAPRYRLRAMRMAHGATRHISQLIRSASERMFAEEESIKRELQERWLSYETAKRRER